VAHTRNERGQQQTKAEAEGKKREERNKRSRALAKEAELKAFEQ
jgi:hypothetical protein